MRELQYPDSPGFKAAGTSREAAVKTAGRAATLRERVLPFLARGPATADECAAAIGETELSVRPRFSELRKMGRVADSGSRRRNSSGHRASVWKLVQVAEQQELFAGGAK